MSQTQLGFNKIIFDVHWNRRKYTLKSNYKSALIWNVITYLFDTNTKTTINIYLCEKEKKTIYCREKLKMEILWINGGCWKLTASQATSYHFELNTNFSNAKRNIPEKIGRFSEGASAARCSVRKTILCANFSSQDDGVSLSWPFQNYIMYIRTQKLRIRRVVWCSIKTYVSTLYS